MHFDNPRFLSVLWACGQVDRIINIWKDHLPAELQILDKLKRMLWFDE